MLVLVPALGLTQQTGLTWPPLRPVTCEAHGSRASGHDDRHGWTLTVLFLHLFHSPLHRAAWWHLPLLYQSSRSLKRFARRIACSDLAGPAWALRARAASQKSLASGINLGRTKNPSEARRKGVESVREHVAQRVGLLV